MCSYTFDVMYGLFTKKKSINIAPFNYIRSNISAECTDNSFNITPDPLNMLQIPLVPLKDVFRIHENGA